METLTFWFFRVIKKSKGLFLQLYYNLEEALNYIQKDEYIWTPKSIRLRKST
jgi:predicted membrane GTPase involved in stress response